MTKILLSALSLTIGLVFGMALTLRPGKRWGLPELPQCRRLERIFFLHLGEGKDQDWNHSMQNGNLASQDVDSMIESRNEVEEFGETGRPVMISMLVSDSSGLDHSDDAIGVHALLPKPISTLEYNRTLALESSLQLDIAKNPMPKEEDRRAWVEKLTTIHNHIYAQILDSKSQGQDHDAKD